MKKTNLWAFLGLITTLLTVTLLLVVLLVSTQKTQPVTQASKQPSVPPAQTQPLQKVQTVENPPDIPVKKPFTPPYDEELSIKIKKVFEPILPEAQSERLGRAYAAIGYHTSIMPGLYDDLQFQHLSAEEQDKYKKLQDAHQQALEIVRQDRAAKAIQSSQTSVPVSKEEKEFYLPGLAAIKGIKGQPQLNTKEIPCPDRYAEYKNWGQTCQEIQFTDGTKSIVYIVNTRGITAREDFDAKGHLLVQHRFWAAGGYFDSARIRHIPNYPATLAGTLFFDRTGAATKIEIYLPNDEAIAAKIQQSFREEFAHQQRKPEIITQSHTTQYCNLYKAECVPL